ncbi:MAG: FIG00461906: hypothetical protein [uncultured Paraburkholderia sp.]|nr:MAG: FIG00461906: hypothetical protein [uncultured Paraburkholderia sp.]
MLESTLSAAGSVANPAGDPRFPRPPQRRPPPQRAPLRSEDMAIGAQGAKLAHASIERTTAFIAEGGATRGSLPMPKFMNPRAIRDTLRRLRNRDANAAAREWGQTLDDHFMQPVIAVNRLFPIPADASREAADARQDAINSLLDGLTLRRPRPARADASLPPAVERLPQACVVPLAQALAEASGGDPILAARILDRLQQPLEIAGDAAHTAPDELERRAWRCAALEGLLRLQFGDGARHAERGNGAAARLVVYLQAGHKLRSIDADLGATPADLNHESTYRLFADDPYGRHAMLALDAARRLPPDAADAHDTGACEIDAITAYRLWQLGFDESGPGSDLARASQLLFDGGTTWVARGAERQARKDRALGPIDGAPPAQRFAHARARIGLAVHDVPQAFGKNRSPIGVSSLLGADTPFFDTTRGRYDTALLDYSNAQLPAATPGRMLTHALNAERMWDAARARVAALRGQGDERMERNVGRTLRMFDDRERRRRFIDDMTEGGFTLAALESWFNASGMAAADAARAEPTARHLQAAHDLLANPGIAPLDRITTHNLREQHLALMAQNVPGTGFTSYDSNALGIDASAWANLPAKLLYRRDRSSRCWAGAIRCIRSAPLTRTAR